LGVEGVHIIKFDSISSTPTVSIIVPTYNRGSFITEMIESVISQTIQDWELIIIDDGSTDNTEHLVRPFLSDKVFYYQLPHKGRSYARNYGIRLSKGVFIAYLDSDDVFLPSKLEKQIKWLTEKPSIAMVYTSALAINDYGDYYPTVYLASDSGNIYEKVGMYLPVTITLPSVMIRKEIQDKIGGFDEELNRFEDTDMWRRISRDYPIDAMPEPLVKVRTHQGNRIDSLDPEILFLDLMKYIQKVIKEDGNNHRKFVSKGAARLLLQYKHAVSTVPGWSKWENKLLLKAFHYQPLFTLYWIGIYRIKSLLQR
jgi:glycosyltransferase involved in cell wall biosynthesis